MNGHNPEDCALRLFPDLADSKAAVTNSRAGVPCAQAAGVRKGEALSFFTALKGRFSTVFCLTK